MQKINPNPNNTGVEAQLTTLTGVVSQLRNDVYGFLTRLIEQKEPLPVVDENADGYTYTGYAPLGTGYGDIGWKITRTSTTGGVTTVEYADGDLFYDNIWDDRLTLSYSR